MDVALIIIGLLLNLIGVAGSILPGLPGISVSWLGLLLIYLTKPVPMNWWILGPTLLVVILMTILDYVIPGMTTKKFGGSKYGVWGTNIGLIVGLLAPIPFGFLIGPIVGAFIGEFLFNKSSTADSSLKAAAGSFIGFITSTFMQFVISIIFLSIYIYLIINHWSQIF